MYAIRSYYVDDDRLLPRRMARTAPAADPLVPRQGPCGLFRLHLDPGNPAAPALRPVDALRVEDPPPAGPPQRGRHGGDYALDSYNFV